MEREFYGKRPSPVLQTRREHSYDYVTVLLQKAARWSRSSHRCGLGKGKSANLINLALSSLRECLKRVNRNRVEPTASPSLSTMAPMASELAGNAMKRCARRRHHDQRPFMRLA